MKYCQALSIILNLATNCIISIFRGVITLDQGVSVLFLIETSVIAKSILVEDEGCQVDPSSKWKIRIALRPSFKVARGSPAIFYGITWGLQWKSTEIHLQIPGFPKRIMYIQLQGFEVGRHLRETKSWYLCVSKHVIFMYHM